MQSVALLGNKMSKSRREKQENHWLVGYVKKHLPEKDVLTYIGLWNYVTL